MRSDNMPRPFAPEHGEEAASQLQRDIERIEMLIPFDPETREAWQRLKPRLTPDRERVADKKRMLHCDTHGEWDTMRASGCPDCVAESRRLLRDASTPRWSDEGEPENLMAAAMDALEWLRYLRDRPAGLPLGSANSERMAGAVSAIERFVPPNAAIDAARKEET